MADYPGAKDLGVTADTVARLTIPSWIVSTPPLWSVVSPQVGTQLTVLGAPRAGSQGAGTITATPTDHDGYLEPGLGRDFFEHIIVLARSYALGIILSQVERDIEIYNAYRRIGHTWSSWTNNCDAGVDIPDFPSLPTFMLPLSGYVGTLTVSTQGPPTINGTIDFVVLGLGTFSTPVTGQRAVMIPFLPETPLLERLGFETDVILSLDGSEQRIALRDVPRQTFDATYQLDGHDRRAFLVILFDAQGRAAGFPLWHEPTWLTAPVSISDTTVYVESTAYADWRADSIGILWSDSENFEALEVASYTANSITFKSPFQNAFPTGAMVMPVRTAYFEELIRGVRKPVKVQSLNVRYLVSEPAVDLSSTAAFSTYRGKVLLDEPNWIEGELEDSLERRQAKLDGEVGLFNAWSEWSATRRGSRKVFFSGSRARLWAVRQLLHALRGRAISFYVPTFFDDLEPIDGITSGSTTLRIKNIGYDSLVRDRSPKGDLQVVLSDGTKINRQIVSSTEISEAEEQLTVSSSWGANAALDEIVRVSFIELVRFDSDEILLEHRSANGEARISAPIKTVLNE